MDQVLIIIITRILQTIYGHGLVKENDVYHPNVMPVRQHHTLLSLLIELLLPEPEVFRNCMSWPGWSAGMKSIERSAGAGFSRHGDRGIIFIWERVFTSHEGS